MTPTLLVWMCGVCRQQCDGCLTGTFEAEPTFTPTNEAGKLLSLSFEHSEGLWPWSGFLALYIRAMPEAVQTDAVASGEVSFTILSPPAPGESEQRRSTVALPVTVQIIPTPPRQVCGGHLGGLCSSACWLSL